MGEARSPEERGRGGRNVVPLAVPALIAGLIGWLLWGNLTIGTTRISVESARLPAAFDGFTIAQVSDLHNAEFGAYNERLIGILRAERPDAIAITGDLVDLNHTNIDVATVFALRAAQLAPCYFIMGNHEAWLGSDYAVLEKRLLAAGVTVLHNQAVTLSSNGERIALLGIDDPERAEPYASDPAAITNAELAGIEPGADFTILLAHRPEQFPSYVAHGIDLVLSGHAHGGQFRIPFVGGVVAPDQGLFPRYDAGLYEQGDTRMVVSRGLGNSTFPVRVNNRPEVVLVELHAGR